METIGTTVIYAQPTLQTAPWQDGKTLHSPYMPLGFGCKGI